MLIKKQNSKGIGFCLKDGLLLHKYLLHVQGAENMCGYIFVTCFQQEEITIFLLQMIFFL